MEESVQKDVKGGGIKVRSVILRDDPRKASLRLGINRLSLERNFFRSSRV